MVNVPWPVLEKLILAIEHTQYSARSITMSTSSGGNLEAAARMFLISEQSFGVRSRVCMRSGGAVGKGILRKGIIGLPPRAIMLGSRYEDCSKSVNVITRSAAKRK
jgi:hypothetical protein